MNPQANKFRYLPLLIAGIAVILSSTVGIAAIMSLLPASNDGSGDVFALDNFPVAPAKPVAVTAQTAPGKVTGDARANGRCAECGVIVSTREIDARYEITIRMADRSNRVINHASPASWRPGERVIVIDGANPLNR